jgi:hypothetical protein
LRQTPRPPPAADAPDPPAAAAQQPAAASPPEAPAAAAPEPPAASAPEADFDRQSEIARDLFVRGKAKWLEGQFEAAAALLGASDEQLSVPSTLALLADSYEHLGRLKSAADAFHRAAELATQKGNLALAHSASTREAALLPRVPQLEIRVAAPLPAALLVTLNGVEVPLARLNAPLALDAGYYQLEARAPGYLPAVSSVRLNNDPAQPGGPQVASVLLAPEPGRVASSAPALPLRADTRAEERREVRLVARRRWGRGAADERRGDAGVVGEVPPIRGQSAGRRAAARDSARGRASTSAIPRCSSRAWPPASASPVRRCSEPASRSISLPSLRRSRRHRSGPAWA